jgi:phosphodiesterase/alkaline phosphatase D-like protein
MLPAPAPSRSTRPVLKSHAHYFYRFVAEGGGVSPAGQFTTAPRDDEKIAIRFGFSGDTSGAFRPFPLVRRFGELRLDYFIFLGDTMYELPSKGSPVASDPFADPAQALADYRRKYLENILPVKPGGFPGLQALFAAQGNYTLLDNHELGNAQFQSGGAPPGNPPGKGTDATDPANDANGSCSFMNQTPGFAALLQAYRDFEPVRERRVSAPGDCRSDGTWQLYFAQRWGANSIFINVDDRSYRDIKMTKPDGGDDTGPRADNPARTMLGATQLEWLKRVLADAQSKGVTWKIVAVSSPIDQVGPFGPLYRDRLLPWDGGKSWIGGYRAERNHLLKFIADNRIDHVVFLTTDDHHNRVLELNYLAEPGDAKSRTPVPGAFTVVAGPLGAGGPDRFTEHDWASVKSVADKLAADERAAGIEPLGLRPDFPGLKQVYREGDPDADTTRQPVDFYSADTLNYVTLEISADGKSLSVDTWGIDSYRPNSFLEANEVAAPRRILGFRINAD